jgi:hypothetical protein
MWEEEIFERGQVKVTADLRETNLDTERLERGVFIEEEPNSTRSSGLLNGCRGHNISVSYGDVQAIPRGHRRSDLEFEPTST